MARIPMVTRTIQTTKANVLCLNIKEEKTFTKEVTLPRTYKDDKQMMKRISALVDTDDTKAVHIVNSTVEETLYGMSEQDFINNAKILPPRTANTEAEAEA